MTPRKHHHNWFVQQISVGNLLSLGAVIFTGAGFYYSTSSTLVAQHGQIAAIEKKLSDNDKREEKQQTAVMSERTTLRSEMTNRAEKTAEGISELNKQTAVLSTQLTSVEKELVKIGGQLSILNNNNPALKR